MFNPYLAVIITTIIWGSAGVFIKYLDLPPTTIAFFRLFIPAIILYPYFKLKKVNLFRENLKLIFLVSLIEVISFLFYFISYENTSVANAVTILYTWPIFAIIFSFVFLKENITGRVIFALLLAFTGVAIIYIGSGFSFSDKDFIGITSMLVSAALSGITIIIFKRLTGAHTIFEIIFYQTFMGAIVFFPFLFINRPFPAAWQFILGFIYALLIGLLAYIPYYFGLKHLKASIVSSISYLEVVSGILFGVLLLHEALTLNVIIGGVLIAGSTLLIKNSYAKV
ncbi:DMT family transporter [Candidatus Woesearchaeota archaeon]|nr:DMT family transporter [Candidatus Woesearchaeota archaeon]